MAGPIEPDEPSSGSDPWARWIRKTRAPDDPAARRSMLDFLVPVRDSVLRNAAIRHGDVVLDVGAGDGLIGFGALERVGPGGRVIFSDVSRELLDGCRAAAAHLGSLDRCSFALAAAEDLRDIPTGSVDIVTVRSVLIFVKDKGAAFRAFSRVLRPAGKVSIFEPINRFGKPEAEHLFFGYDVSPVADLGAKVVAAFDRRQPLGVDPLLDFDERDLVSLAEAAGFSDLHVETRVDIEPRVEPREWEPFASTPPNPLAPSLLEAMAETLTPQEAERFAAHLRPRVERGEGRRRSCVAFLWGSKRAAWP